ncbi:hypothetical protein [Micromonospora rhizosphaerae]|uniref:hypothetical protein n=1 Tax=Micromonospora rhizosphaerae TaxID=568872 RepID=UPI00114D1E24|nr:hypothetical protein [Micromonospora rhizosphaerae]
MTTARRRQPASGEQADRLTLIDRWHHFVLDQPVLVYAGETIWLEDGHLLVRRLDGRLDSYPAP